MQISVEHMGLPARNPTRLKDWYIKVLGAELVFEKKEQPPVYFVRLPGGLMIEIYEGDFSLKEIADNAMNGWRHMALRVPTIEQAKAELALRGVMFADPIKPAAGGGRVLFFRDPEDNLLHLVERPAGTVFQ